MMGDDVPVYIIGRHSSLLQNDHGKNNLRFEPILPNSHKTRPGNHEFSPGTNGTIEQSCSTWVWDGIHLLFFSGLAVISDDICVHDDALGTVCQFQRIGLAQSSLTPCCLLIYVVLQHYMQKHTRTYIKHTHTYIYI